MWGFSSGCLMGMCVPSAYPIAWRNPNIFPNLATLSCISFFDYMMELILDQIFCLLLCGTQRLAHQFPVLPRLTHVFLSSWSSLIILVDHLSTITLLSAGIASARNDDGLGPIWSHTKPTSIDNPS